jgi:hypothetical protein
MCIYIYIYTFTSICGRHIWPTHGPRLGPKTWAHIGPHTGPPPNMLRCCLACCLAYCFRVADSAPRRAPRHAPQYAPPHAPRHSPRAPRHAPPHAHTPLPRLACCFACCFACCQHVHVAQIANLLVRHRSRRSLPSPWPSLTHMRKPPPTNRLHTPTHPHTHTYKPIRNILDPQREDGFPNGTRLESAGLRKRKGSETLGLRWLESEGARLITVVSVFRAPSERAQPKLRLVYCAAQPFLGLLAPGPSGPGMWNPKATSPNANVWVLTCSPHIIVLRLACSPNVRVRLLELSPNANDVLSTFHQLLLCCFVACSTMPVYGC